jgi:hypothetical protein
MNGKATNSCERRRRVESFLGVLSAAVIPLLFAGCTGGRAPESPPPTTAPSVAPETTMPEATAPTETLVPIEFAFERPDVPCPPPSQLDNLSLSDEHIYALEPRLIDQSERFYRFKAFCRYTHADIGDGEDMVVEEHAAVVSEIALYREWGDSPFAGQYPELPVGSHDLHDWEVAVWAEDDRGVWWEGCGPETPCEAGEPPTVRTRARQLRFEGHVGNLEFDAAVIYIGERLPADVEARVVAIFRDLVLASIDNYARAD